MSRRGHASDACVTIIAFGYNNLEENSVKPVSGTGKYSYPEAGLSCNPGPPWPEILLEWEFDIPAY